jgi:alpha-tubulin suppressor-like RCC1 family protein
MTFISSGEDFWLTICEPQKLTQVQCLDKKVSPVLSFIGMPLGGHTILLDLEGRLWGFGSNSEGQLGLGYERDEFEPAEISWNGPQPVQLEVGGIHSLILDAQGAVWYAGHSRTCSTSETFQRLPELPCISLVAAGGSHSAAIDAEGRLWVWTSDISLSWACSLPQRVRGLPPIINVTCGFGFLVAEAGEDLWVLGDNSKGQLGLGHTNDALQPTLVHVEDRSEGPLRFLAALFDAVIIIDSQGAVFSAGGNSYGHLGRSSGDHSKLERINNIPPMLAASCGGAHTFATDENGGVWTWGLGESGQLGTGNTSNQPEPILVPSLEGMRAVLAFGEHSWAFPQEGGLLVFGHNGSGGLGLGINTPDLSTPTLSLLQPALPHSFTRSTQKSARFL